RRLTPDQVAALWPAIERIAKRKVVRLRIDCAMVPLLSLGLIPAFEASELEALGVFGCEAARHLGALDVGGSAAPCSFLPAGAAPASALAEAWDTAPHLAELRAYHAEPAPPCDTCPLRPVCRGGCQVVSRHTTGAFGPD